MNRIQERRLRKLAEHLNGDNLFQTKWDFSKLHEIIDEDDEDYSTERQNNPCGTVGCAIGEVPFLFNKEERISFNSIGEIVFNDYEYSDIVSFAIEFFGLTNLTASILFLPLGDMRHIADIYKADAKRLGLDILNSSASKLDVAYNINALLDYYKRNNLITEN